MSNDTLNKIASELESNDMNELKSHIDDLDKALAEDTFMQKAKLPEGVFKSTFLPVLNGEEQNNDVTLMKYVEYAGGPYKEVDIIGKDGETIYTCPPLYSRSSSNLDKSRLPYSEIAGTYELKKARLPQEANRYMDDIAEGIGRTIEVEENSNEYRWSKIFDRYAKPVEEVSTEPVFNSAQSNKEVDDLIDYD